MVGASLAIATGYSPCRREPCIGMQLENFGCGGATTSSIPTLTAPAELTATVLRLQSEAGPCTPLQTQNQDAHAFRGANPGQIGLITVSIGGSDVTSCAANANPVPCVPGVVPTVKANVTTVHPCR